MRCNTRQGQDGDRDRQLGEHEIQRQLMIPVLLGEVERHGDDGWPVVVSSKDDGRSVEGTR